MDRQSGGEESRPARHPILDRLENNDFDVFSGQSLDYEPNLEFDDTDLKEELDEEELNELSANIMFNLNCNAQQHQQQQENSSEQVEGKQTNTTSSSSSSLSRQEAAESNCSTTNNAETQLNSNNIEDGLFLVEQPFDFANQQQSSPTIAYLESPHDLLEENFEEAFKSSLFNLEQANEAAAKAKSKLLLKRAASTSSNKNGRLNSFFRQATSGFYVNKQSLLDDSLEELKLDDLDFDEGDDFSDIAKHNCVELAGDDLFGRRIITIYACRLPNATRIHHLRLLKYIMYTLDRYVENDYCVVYFHFGLNSQNKPKLNFLYQAYKAFDRKYKKNLKALFLVHPTNFIRIVWQLFKPIIR